MATSLTLFFTVGRSKGNSPCHCQRLAKLLLLTSLSFYCSFLLAMLTVSKWLLSSPVTCLVLLEMWIIIKAIKCLEIVKCLTLLWFLMHALECLCRNQCSINFLTMKERKEINILCLLWAGLSKHNIDCMSDDLVIHEQPILHARLHTERESEQSIYIYTQP